MSLVLRLTFVEASLHLLSLKKKVANRNIDVANVIRALDLSPVNMALALVFLHRYQQNEVNSMDSSECENLPYYLMISSLVLANKCLNDQSYTLKLWLSILRKCLALLPSLTLLNQMEAHMLAALNYKLSAAHDLLLWKGLCHLHRGSVQKLRVAAECERPGAFKASGRPVKRSMDEYDLGVAQKKPHWLLDAGLGSLLVPLSASVGLASPPLSQASPTSYYPRHAMKHRKTQSTPSYKNGCMPYAYQAAPMQPAPSLHSAFVPPLVHTNFSNFNQAKHTAISAVPPVMPSSGYTSVYATPCSHAMATFTPNAYTGAYAPMNYGNGASMTPTPNLMSNPITPMSVAGSTVPYFVAHPYLPAGSPLYAQTPLKSLKVPVGPVDNMGLSFCPGLPYTSRFEMA